MAPWLKALASPPEDMDSPFKTHRTANNCLELSFHGIKWPFGI